MTARDQIFAGRFVIEQQLDGQQAAVYRARDLETGADVALKLLRDAPKRAVARFTREAAVVADLEHPAIVRYVQHGLVDDTWYLATEWIDGVDLALLLETDPPNTSQSLAIAIVLALG